jgi:ascorbate-specific PTS system EIIC-type component UlaA
MIQLIQCGKHTPSFYYPDQQMHNININNILYVVSTATCFDESVSPSTLLKLQESLRFFYDTDASKHVAVLSIYKILFIYIYCAFVGLDDKLDKMHSAFINAKNTPSCF